MSQGSGDRAAADSERIGADRRDVGLVAREQPSLGVGGARPGQQVPLLFLAWPRTPRRRYDDQLRPEPAERGELVREPQVVAGRQSDRHVLPFERHQLVARRNGIGLA